MDGHVPPEDKIARSRPMRGWPLIGSVVIHVGVFALWGLATARAIGHPPRPTPPPIAIMLTPPPSPKPRPRAVGDLPVPARSLPAPAPTPTPTPHPTPTPMATPSPTATTRPTPRPTPIPRATPSAERGTFRVMRTIPYFSKMSDAELRKQKLPPGMHNWNQVITMGRQLDGLNWLFLPPETGQTPAPTPATANPAHTPVPGATPSALPSPQEQVDPDGNHMLTFKQEHTLLNVMWKDGDANVEVYFRADDAPEAEDARRFEVPYVADRTQLVTDVIAGYLEALFASPSPVPSASAIPIAP